MTIRIATGDALTVLRQLSGELAHTAVMSPPYWMTRDYGVDGQLGREPTPQEYVESLCGVLDEVWRVLRPDGSCWVVMGDTYFGRNSVGRRKSLASVPSRFEIAMTERGWILRNRIVWHKPNAIPTSIKDRFTIDYEFVFFFAKNEKYYFDRQVEKALFPGGVHVNKRAGSKGETIKRTVNPTYFARNVVTGEFRNRRCVWTITTARCPEAHFAVYPEKLVEIAVRAACPEGGTVLDPFTGAGTSGIVCDRLGRSFLGIELNPAYVEIARKRILKARQRRASKSVEQFHDKQP
jgi:site-specific DNA-methyltransferase (adenine-specific)